MHIKVKTLGGKVYTSIPIEPEQTVDNLKDTIVQHIPSIPRKGQKLVYAGKVLEGDASISGTNLKDGDFVVVLIGRTAPLPSIDPTPEPNAQTILAATTQHINIKPLLAEEEEEEEEAHPQKTKDTMEVDTTEEKKTTKALPTSLNLKELVDTLIGTLSPQTRRSQPKRTNDSTATTTSTSTNTESNDESASSEDTAPRPRLPSVDPSALRQLQDMGFAENRAKKALLLHKMNEQMAMEWLLMHNEDADIDEPLSEEQIQAITEAESTFEPNPETARQLQEMGFDAEDVNRALRVTRNNQDSALAWLLGDRSEGDGGGYEGDEKGSDEDDDDGDVADSELVQVLLNHPRVKEALGEPRVVAALEKLMENPASVDELLADEEIGPIVQQLNDLINNEL